MLGMTMGNKERDGKSKEGEGRGEGRGEGGMHSYIQTLCVSLASYTLY